jgi:hypothetical protein
MEKMLALKRFDFDGEGKLSIELRFVRAGDIKQIVDLLVRLGAVTDEDIVSTDTIEIDGEKYMCVKRDEEGNPANGRSNTKTKPESREETVSLQAPREELGDKDEIANKILAALNERPMAIKELAKEIYGHERYGDSQHKHIDRILRDHLLPNERVVRKETPSGSGGLECVFMVRQETHQEITPPPINPQPPNNRSLFSDRRIR